MPRETDDFNFWTLRGAGPLLGGFSRTLQNNLVGHPDYFTFSSGPGACPPNIQIPAENTQRIP
jgi:hypothetical protein